MTPKAKQLASEAGFLIPVARLSQQTQSREVPGKVLGMRLIASPLMPEGYVALVTDKGAMVLPPSGKAYFLDYEPIPSHMEMPR